MIDNPLISVIVPVYNVERYIEQCINSIANQTYRNLEIILVDDGSVDKSGEICDRYEKDDIRIKVIHQLNAGVGAARNKGIELANGEYIAFVDGDDYIDATMYEDLATAIGDAPIAFCRFKHEYKHKSQYYHEEYLLSLTDRPFDYRYYTDENGSHIEGDYLYCSRVFGSVWRSLFRRKIIRDNNICFSTKLKIAEDRLFLLEYVKYCKKAVVIDSYLYHYRMSNEASATKMMIGKYKSDLAWRNQFLVEEQIKLVHGNTGMSNSEISNFVKKLRYNACSEVVQNEIRYSSDYKKNLTQIFKTGFYRQSVRFCDVIDIYINKGLRRAVYFLLIRLRMWDCIKRRI